MTAVTFTTWVLYVLGFVAVVLVTCVWVDSRHRTRGPRRNERRELERKIYTAKLELERDALDAIPWDDIVWLRRHGFDVLVEIAKLNRRIDRRTHHEYFQDWVESQ